MSASTAAIDAALSGYDAVVSPDRGEDSPAARRRAMMALEREYASDASGESEDDIGAARRAARGGSGEYDDSEDEAWAALRGDARAAKSITGSAVVRRSRTARYESESDGEGVEDFEAFEAYVAGVRREPSRAMRGVRAARKYDALVSDELEDSARKAMERVEYKVERYEDESAAFVRKNLNAALEESALTAEEQDAFRVKAQQVLEKQTYAFEQVLDATDRAFSGRLNVVDAERERVRQRFGDDYESAYARANDVGFDMDLKVSSSGSGIPLVGILFKPIGAAFAVTKFAAFAPLNILGAPFNILGRLTRIGKGKKRVDEDQAPSAFDTQLSPTKSRLITSSVPSSPGARSDISSLNGMRRWPVGAAAQRAPGAQRRYSVAGSVRSMTTRNNLYKDLDDVSEADEDEEEVPAKNKLTRAVVRFIQLGCLSAVISLSFGPGERAKKTRAIVEQVQRKVQRAASTLLAAFLTRWATVSSKLSAPPKPTPKRKTASVAAPEVIPIQVPSIITLSSDDAQDLPSDVTYSESQGVTFANAATLDGEVAARMSKAQVADLRKAYGRG